MSSANKVTLNISDPISIKIGDLQEFLCPPHHALTKISLYVYLASATADLTCRAIAGQLAPKWSMNLAKMIRENVTASTYLNHLRQTGAMQNLLQRTLVQSTLDEINERAEKGDKTLVLCNVEDALEAARNTDFAELRGVAKNPTHSEIHDVSVWWNIFSFLSYGDIDTNKPIEPRVVELDDDAPDGADVAGADSGFFNDHHNT